jgi:ABC-2 type transport system permease protein
MVVHEKGHIGLIGIELVKQLRRAGYWAVFGALAVVALVVTVIIATTSGSTPERLGDFGSVIPNSSGFTMAPVALNSSLLFLIPLAVAIFAGESVAGEASWGSLRYLVARPVSRNRVLASKVVVAAILSLAAVVIVSAVGFLSGIAAFGWHPLSVLDLQRASPFSSGITTLSPLGALVRIVIATGIVAGAMLSTFCFTVLCSVLTDRPLTAVAGGVLLAFVSRALDNIPGLHAFGPWLPLTDRSTSLWTEVLFQPTDLGGLPHLAIVQLAYAVIFLGAAALYFNRKDVMS